jgi:hypothetical protein
MRPDHRSEAYIIVQTSKSDKFPYIFLISASRFQVRDVRQPFVFGRNIGELLDCVGVRVSFSPGGWLFRESEISTEPAYYMLMFSKNGREYTEYFRVYIELEDEDKALLGGVLTDAMKARLMTARVGFLPLLPSGLSDRWPDFGSVIEPASKTSGKWVSSQPA